MLANFIHILKFIVSFIVVESLILTAAIVGDLNNNDRFGTLSSCVNFVRINQRLYREEVSYVKPQKIVHIDMYEFGKSARFIVASYIQFTSYIQFIIILISYSILYVIVTRIWSERKNTVCHFIHEWKYNTAKLGRFNDFSIFFYVCVITLHLHTSIALNTVEQLTILYTRHNSKIHPLMQSTLLELCIFIIERHHLNLRKYLVDV